MRLRKGKLEYWILTECQMHEGYMQCKMESSFFDKVTSKMYDTALPIINGEGYTFISTPAYPIVIKRDKPYTKEEIDKMRKV